MAQITIPQAVIEVLKLSGSPMSVADIHEQIVVRNLYVFNTPDPLNIVRKAIRRHCINIQFGESAQQKYFIYLDSGKYWLIERESDQQIIPLDVEGSKIAKDFNSYATDLLKLRELYINNFKENILEKLKKLSPTDFEIFSKKFLEAYGFEDMTTTPLGRDGGIDGRGKLKVGMAYLRVAFQAKRWGGKPVGRPEISQFRGDIQGKVEQGYFFTTSTFTKEAEEASFQPGAVPIILFDGQAIIESMLNKGIAIEKKTLEIYEDAFDLLMADDDVDRLA